MTSIPRTTRRIRPGGQKRLVSGGFLLVIIYFIFEYLRVQDNVAPFMAAIKVPALITLSLCVFFLRTEKEYLKDPIVLALLFFFIEIVSWVPFAKNNFYAFQTARNMFITLVSVFALVASINSEDRLFYFLKFYSILLFIIAIWVLTHGGVGPGGFLQDENDVALVLVTGLPIVFYILIGSEDKVERVLGLVIFVLVVSAVVASASRGGFLGLVSSLLFMLWSSRKRWRNIALVFFLSISVGGVFVALLPDDYVAEVKSIKNTNEGTANIRFLHWTTAIEIFKDNPVWGVGPNNYPWTSGDYLHLSPYFVEGARFRSGRQAHSLYFTLIPELGVVGISLFFFMTYKYFKRFRKLGRSSTDLSHRKLNILAISKAMKAAMVGFLVTAAFISVLYYPVYWHLLGLSVVIFRIAQKPEGLDHGDH
ncbi:O-antigen polymerase family protein [Marinobacter nitratireducens]|uniref:O-antigen polymerase family protein n=1 Tax=Marinobacter nitratireducens TaxID=1137280 RepID=A0A072NGJ2_9GAMM|nr:O-antigen ligase family protein [Marinobacter nitratireducens]KEF32230.1 O-antigen polymerase family protein [Marinobacter nitratireducens]